MPAFLKFKDHGRFQDFTSDGSASFMLPKTLGKGIQKAFIAGKGISFQLLHASVTPPRGNFITGHILAGGLITKNFVRFHRHKEYLAKALKPDFGFEQEH
jgi:hypothetical protein